MYLKVVSQHSQKSLIKLSNKPVLLDKYDSKSTETVFNIDYVSTCSKKKIQSN